jgi:iron-sulfur cluster repair protein YtfE (RIC family)
MKAMPAGAGPLIEPLPENLFRQPIDCLYADHFRLRMICSLLARLAGDEVGDSAADMAPVVIAYLERDLPMHIADEEDLLPLLCARCDPADNIDAAAATLHEEHRDELRLGEALLPGLKRIAADPGPGELAVIGRQLAGIADDMRRHLAREECLVLPLARRRLLPADMTAIGRRMAARRGVAYPEG